MQSNKELQRHLLGKFCLCLAFSGLAWCPLICTIKKRKAAMWVGDLSGYVLTNVQHIDTTHSVETSAPSKKPCVMKYMFLKNLKLYRSCNQTRSFKGNFKASFAFVWPSLDSHGVP